MTKKKELKVGDRAKVIKESFEHDFQVGTVVEVMGTYLAESWISCRREDGLDQWMERDELRKMPAKR